MNIRASGQNGAERLARFEQSVDRIMTNEARTREGPCVTFPMLQELTFSNGLIFFISFRPLGAQGQQRLRRLHQGRVRLGVGVDLGLGDCGVGVGVVVREVRLCRIIGWSNCKKRKQNYA